MFSPAEVAAEALTFHGNLAVFPGSASVTKRLLALLLQHLKNHLSTHGLQVLQLLAHQHADRIILGLKMGQLLLQMTEGETARPSRLLSDQE